MFIYLNYFATFSIKIHCLFFLSSKNVPALNSKLNYLSEATVYEYNNDNGNKNLSKVCGHSLGLNKRSRCDCKCKWSQSIYTLLPMSWDVSFIHHRQNRIQDARRYTYMVSQKWILYNDCFVFHQMYIYFVACEPIGSCKSIYIFVGQINWRL